MSRQKNYSFIVLPQEASQRIDQFLSRKISGHSRSYLAQLIKSKLVLVNGESVKASHRLKASDRVEVTVPEPQVTELVAENIPLEIIYEDSFLLVINKPAGMVVHPGAGNRQGTLVNALLAHCKDLSGIGGRLRPGIVHRLDKNTSGLLVVAKNDEAHLSLQRQFAEKTARRVYKALVWGRVVPSSGRVETHLERSKRDPTKFVVSTRGKEAVTLYEVEKYYDFLSLLNVTLKTGRSHQIRIHFKYLNHPVFGDPDYSGRTRQIVQLKSKQEKDFALRLLKIMPRQALHAFRLGFVHPATRQWVEFHSPLPEDFSKVLKLLENTTNTL